MTVSDHTDMLPQLTTAGGRNLIGGLSHVFHCNHYNAYLQMTVLLTQGLAHHHPELLLTDTITPLIRILKQQGYTDDDLLHQFSYCGFGVLQQLNDYLWETPSSHYGEAIYLHGKPRKSCYFTSGYLQGLLNQTVTETECQVLGAPSDQFEILPEKPLIIENYLTRMFELQVSIPDRFSFNEYQAQKTRVNEDKVTEIFAELPLYGNENTGLIDAFGVVLTNHFADYYNRVSYETYFALQAAGIPEEESKEMFIQAGHICAFNTFGGIMSSPEWYAVVKPMCDTREDWFHGMVAIINLLGWGIYRIEKIEINQEFIVRIYNSYEGIGYRRMYPMTTDKNISFLAMGAVLGLVHLLWKVDIRTRPSLTPDFYVKQFNHRENSFHVEQTHAIAAGDEYDRIVVSRGSSS
jgi:hypothetical protein